VGVDVGLQLKVHLIVQLLVRELRAGSLLLQGFYANRAGSLGLGQDPTQRFIHNLLNRIELLEALLLSRKLRGRHSLD